MPGPARSGPARFRPGRHELDHWLRIAPPGVAIARYPRRVGTIIGLLLALMSAWMLRRTLRPARAVWGGDARSVPHMVRFQPKARTYLTYLLVTTPAFAGLVLLGLDVAVADAVVAVGRSDGPPRAFAFVGVVAIGLVWVALPMVTVHAYVSMFARPKILIAPANRDQPGVVVQWRAGRKARRG